MIRNYFKIAYRNLLRNKGFSFLNISGLAVGMASAMLILLWIQNEVSYDRFHSKGDRLFEAWSLDRKAVDGEIRAYTPTPEVLAPALKKDYPDIEEVTRVGWSQTVLMKAGEKYLKGKGMFVDSGFLTMFSFPLVAGDPNTALREPNSIVITEDMANKLFGNVHALGKTIKFDNEDNLVVTGIAKNLPNNTDFNFEYLTSYERKTAKGWIDNDWTDFSIRTFVLLKPKVSEATTTEKIKNTIFKYSGGRALTNLFLYPVNQLRLYSNFKNGKVAGGRIDTVKILGMIAAFVLLIACINFMNLSTARSEKRAKEVGIRKVAGALKQSLVFQFLSESVLFAFVAGVLALGIVELVLPSFNELTQKQLDLHFGNGYILLAFIGFILVTGLLAGSYPAFFLSAFKPVAVLKGSFKRAHAWISPRKVLVVTQFTIAIALIVCTMIVYQQLRYGAERKAGYDRSRMAYVFLEGDLVKNYELVKQDLIAKNIASAVSQTHAPLTQLWSSGHGLSWEGKDPRAEITFNRSTTDGDLVKTAGLELVAGRDIDLKNFPSDSSACLINETAAKIMAQKNIIGAWIHDNPNTWHVVGVVKDFILESPYEPIKPIIFKGPKAQSNVMNIRFNPARSIAENLASAQSVFKQYNPEYPFEYHFMDEEYERKFSNEKLTTQLAFLFAALTIFISCLGLFGLATYMAEARIREIGIRKVLGATVRSITALMSKDFLKLILVSILVASPIAYWAMNKWLQGYSYKINIDWKVFAGAGSVALLIAVLTVSYQSVKAALTNPARSLKEM